MNVSKIKVQYLLDLLKTYSITSSSFRDVDEHYQSLAAVTQPAASDGSGSTSLKLGVSTASRNQAGRDYRQGDRNASLIKAKQTNLSDFL